MIRSPAMTAPSSVQRNLPPKSSTTRSFTPLHSTGRGRLSKKLW
jgi:hypothetical protein